MMVAVRFSPRTDWQNGLRRVATPEPTPVSWPTPRFKRRYAALQRYEPLAGAESRITPTNHIAWAQNLE